MGDSSTCLLRSFSTPSETSCVHQEGNPLRALGDSVSFGRFMSESLDWEKWSTFSHNRYVEEAEKYSKPGTVAAKKAYFEAHYKRKAAERAAALVEEANALANGTSGSETREGTCTDSNTETNLQADNIATSREQQDKETVNYPVVDCADTKQYEHDPGDVDLGISVEEEAEDVAHPRIDNDLNDESSMFVDNSNQSDHVEVRKNISVPIEERMCDSGNASKEVLDSPTLKGREVNSSPKLSTTKTRAAKLPHSLDERKVAAAIPIPPLRSGMNKGSKGKKPVVDSVERKRLTTPSLCMLINRPSGNGETTKKIVSASQSRNSSNRFSTSKKSPGISVEKKRITAPSLSMSIGFPSGAGVTSKTATSATTPRNRIKFIKSVGDSMEKRTTARSLHMSIDLSSGAGETGKTNSVLERNRITQVHSNLPRDHPVTSRTSTKASNGLLNQASANTPYQNRRSERLNKSVSGSVTANAKLSSISAANSCLKSPRTTKSNSQSATISLPFRFRSEERAVKRKELLRRMDENKSKEEDKVQLRRIPKGKTEHDHKKPRQSVGSKSKLNDEKPDGSQSPSNQIRKSSLALLRSPKHGTKASSSTIQDKNFGNSWTPPISTKNSRPVTEKSYRTTTTRQSITSLSNTTRENASPNIQN